MTNKVEALVFQDDRLTLVDQRLLPHTIEYVQSQSIEDVHKCIKDMVVRGAPLIGFSALYGMALWVRKAQNLCENDVSKAREYLESSRPTAVNLAYEARRAQELILELMGQNVEQAEIYNHLVRFANQEMVKLAQDNLTMAKLVEADLLKINSKKKFKVMTLCNTGFLACGPMGTALGVISHLHRNQRIEHVYAFETRPYLQGSRLTAFELTQENIPHDIVVEGAMSYIMRTQKIDAIFIGADRIVSNGDTANKVGSSTLSIVAKRYGVPFYVVAPTSSFDMSLSHGDQIEVELRPQDEILSLAGKRIAPHSSSAFNPSFDITDHDFIHAISCENGLIHPVSKAMVEKVVKG